MQTQIQMSLLDDNQIAEIVKRDGRTMAFDEEKIAVVVKKAFQAVGEYQNYSYYREVSGEVLQELYARSMLKPTVEQVQDMVEEVLIRNNHANAAKAFILYRSERSRIREMNTRLMKVYEDITFKDARDSDIKRENANVNGDTAMGVMLKYGSEGAKEFYEKFILNPAHAKAHADGDIHIHDLDFLTMTTTCCQIDLIKLFTDGFSTGHGAIREPKDIASYSALTCIAIQANQNDQHGGQSIGNFDYGLAPGVAKTFIKQYRSHVVKALDLLTGGFDGDEEKFYLNWIKEWLASGGVLRMGEMDAFRAAEKETLLGRGCDAGIVDKCQKSAYKNALADTNRITFQAMEALIHNLNTMNSRAGAQVPFSSINYGTDTSPEGRMIIRNTLLALDDGLGGGETPIFPIQIFRVKAGVSFNEGDPNYDLFKLACKVSAKRLYPNFSFLDAPYNLQYYQPGRPETEIAYMGCRTRVMGNIYDRSRETAFGRGNLSYSSVNLPRLGIKAEGHVDLFFQSLDETIELCVEQLLERFQIQSAKKVRNFPFLMGQGVWMDSENLDKEDVIGEVLKHGTLTVGFIGLAECLVALTGKHHGQSEESQALGLRIVSHMRRRMDEESEKRGLNFTLIATPAEGLSGRFVKIDRKLFGSLPGITDKEYYTNSFHIPVYFSMNAFDKINAEAPYHALTNAGHITYVELDGDTRNNVEAFEKIIRYMQSVGVGYGSINHPVDRDPVCGYTGMIGNECPACGRNESDGIPFERIRRITGYLVGTLDRFNNAKRAEVRDRVKHQC